MAVKSTAKILLKRSNKTQKFNLNLRGNLKENKRIIICVDHAKFQVILWVKKSLFEIQNIELIKK